MARLEVVTYTIQCDDCGDEILKADSADAKRKVSFGGRDYVLELCVAHRKALDEALDALEARLAFANAKKNRRASTAARPATRPASTSKYDQATVRAWAQSHGHSVGDRGRIPGKVTEAYEAAQRASAAPVEETPVAAAKAAPVPRKRGKLVAKATATDNGNGRVVAPTAFPPGSVLAADTATDTATATRAPRGRARAKATV